MPTCLLFFTTKLKLTPTCSNYSSPHAQVQWEQCKNGGGTRWTQQYLSLIQTSVKNAHNSSYYIKEIKTSTVLSLLHPLQFLSVLASVYISSLSLFSCPVFLTHYKGVNWTQIIEHYYPGM